MSVHAYSRFLHHYETDSDGVCHFSNYLRIFEEGFASALRALLSGRAPLEHAFAVIEAHSTYQHPIRYGEQFRVDFRFDSVRRSFFTAVARIYVGDTMCAEINAKLAATSTTDNRSVALDSALRATLNQLTSEENNGALQF